MSTQRSVRPLGFTAYPHSLTPWEPASILHDWLVTNQMQSVTLPWYMSSLL